jgi:ketosteroid isomerase-like protein
MTTHEVAAQLVALCRDGKYLDAVDTLYADDIVSIEAVDYQGLGREMRGKDAIVAKNAGWLRDNDVHTVTVKGPFVSPETFAVHYSFEWTQRATGEHVKFGEVGVYAVENGKITREEFLYAV